MLLACGGLVAGRCTLRASPVDTPTTAPSPTVGPATSPPVAQGPIPITVLHVNDLHGALYAESKGDRDLGGVAQLVGQIERERASAAGPVLLMDAGDAIQGTFISNRSRGEAVFEILNAAGLSAMTLGNHEFDWGLDVLRERIEQARFPVLAANLESTADQALESVLPGVSPYVVLDAGGVRIGVLGLTYHDLTTVVRASAVEGLRSLPGLETVERYLPELRDRADLIVILSHMGLEGDRALARTIPEVQLIIGGHSHQVLQEGARVGQTVIAQAGAYGEYLG
jgi:2',3'-cyclic-nucleotide 2'-phosphodiesterase (5'-nucleotidase family)